VTSAALLLDRLRSQTYIFAAALAVALLVANLVVQSSFVSSGALPATLANFAPFAVVAMATVPSVLVGGLDFSIGPQLSLANVMFVAVLIPAGLGGAAAIPILLALGALVGGLSGATVSYLRIPPILTGLGALFIVGGVAQQILLSPEQAPTNWTEHLAGKIGPVPGALLVIAVPLVVWFLLRRTPLVRAMYSLGGDAPTAFAAGMNVAGIRIVAYALGGAFAALAGIAVTGVIQSADASLGLQYTLIAIAAVSLGGTPIGGGRGGLFGALLGAICIFLIQNLLVAAEVPPQWLNVVYGGVLVAAVVLSTQIAPKRAGALA
jgi:ribose transport system permease protein